MTASIRPTILVVEDNTPLRRMIARTLQRNGFNTCDAGDAEDCMSVLRDSERAIDLAIVDMLLPGMSGLDLAAILESQSPPVKVLYISGRGDSIALESIAVRSPELVLLKPFPTWRLIDRVRHLLEEPSDAVDGASAWSHHLPGKLE